MKSLLQKNGLYGFINGIACISDNSVKASVLMSLTKKKTSSKEKDKSKVEVDNKELVMWKAVYN